MRAKSTLREQVRKQRAQRSAADRTAAGQALAAALDGLVANATSVAAYAAVGTEPPTAAIIALCRERRIRLLLPVLQPDGDLDWSAVDTAGDRAPAPLAPGPRGLLEPTGPRLGADAIAGCDLVLVPALAVDGHGHRLGRGGGSYDRALTRTTGRTLALLYDGELIDHVPTDAHDVAVSGVVLPALGIVNAAGHPGL